MLKVTKIDGINIFFGFIYGSFFCMMCGNGKYEKIFGKYRKYINYKRKLRDIIAIDRSDKYFTQ